MRVPVWAFLAIGAITVLGAGCGASQQEGGGGQSGAPGGGSGGDTGTGGKAPGAGGSTPQATGGAPQSSGFDDGKLFPDAGPPTAPPMMDAGPAQPPVDGGSGIPGDGNTATAKVPTFGLSAVFTQKGADVTVVVTATKCPAGAHTIHIHEGFACDDPTNKPIWGGKRGDGFGTLTCTADQKGTLTHTRSGADPATKWTLGDQNLMTDVTLHPIFIDGQSCGTFF
jgi:hypothetical protein